MWSESRQIQLEAILSHPGLVYEKINEYKYLLHFRERSWFLWPRSGKYQHVFEDGRTSEMFKGNLREFQHRYLTGSVSLPENFGKLWSAEDENTLYEMIESSYSVNQIARELQRHPVSVVARLAKLLNDETLPDRVKDDFFELPLASFLE